MSRMEIGSDPYTVRELGDLIFSSGRQVVEVGIIAGLAVNAGLVAVNSVNALLEHKKQMDQQNLLPRTEEVNHVEQQQKI